MSIHTNIAIPTTLTDLFQARNDALRLITDSLRMHDMAKKLLKQYGPYLMPRGAQASANLECIRSELDSSMWRRALDLTGFKHLMDAKAVEEFENSLGSSAPEFSEANIRATFIDLRINAESMFRRGVFNIFRYLSDSYRTNQSEPFRLGRKVVMRYMISPSHRCGLSISSSGADSLNDLDRVFHVLDNKPFQPRALEFAMNTVFEGCSLFESGYYRARAFKNGNLHVEFKRLDLLDKVNEQIADFYAYCALPDGRFA
ncbi:DUF4942 domain-containing protein [Pseudomonas helleri]|uniref:DUF4942 domain-containing protein n=1 Tax=Pseudomonas helleri TaxID=1608996 RepID=UPI003FD24EA5